MKQLRSKIVPGRIQRGDAVRVLHVRPIDLLRTHCERRTAGRPCPHINKKRNMPSTATTRLCVGMLQIEVFLVVYTGIFAIVSPDRWASQLMPQDGRPQPWTGQRGLGWTDLFRHGGVANIALAAVLQMTLYNDQACSLMLKGLLVGDSAQLLACALLARSTGAWDTTTTAYAVMTLVFCAGRRGGDPHGWAWLCCTGAKPCKL